MSISAAWDAESQLWLLESTEEFDLGDIAELVERTDWRGAKRFLWDLRALKRGPDSSPELRVAVRLVDRSREQWAGSRAAILVSRDLDFGIARMFGAFADQIDVDYHAFRDEPSAREWLAEGPSH